MDKNSMPIFIGGLRPRTHDLVLPHHRPRRSPQHFLHKLSHTCTVAL